MYEELIPRPPLAGVVRCEWERGPGTGDLLVLPDGCVDIVWRSDGELFVAGPDLGPVVHHRPPGIEFVGLRLQPGAAASVLGVPANEVLDRQVPLSDLWGRAADALAGRLGDRATGPARRELLAGAVMLRLADAEIDVQVLAAARVLSAGAQAVPDVADHVGLSDRQLHRRFVRQVGYGPKAFERVMRFRRFLSSIDDTDGPLGGLATLAVAAGYADQAHLTRECRRLAGRTPRQLLAAA